MVSRNHTIRLYRKDEKKWHCGVLHCLNEATHVCSYDYVTGRFGRISTVNMDRCREHAQKFLQKHDAKYVRNIDADVAE